MLLRALARRPTIARRALTTANPPDPKPHTMAAVGATAGTLGSLAGMGGGFVAIPLMTRLGVSQHTAHGTSLVGVVCTGAARDGGAASQGAEQHAYESLYTATRCGARGCDDSLGAVVWRRGGSTAQDCAAL